MPIESHAFAEFDDILGGDISPLDRTITITVFDDAFARTKSERTTTLRSLAEQIHQNTATRKTQLPLLKLARFGDVSTVKGCLRHDTNVLSIAGVEGDYDGERVSVAEASARLHAAGIAAAICTSPSHSPERPRWRVLCPFSESAPPEARERIVARLNSALGGILSAESFTLSQSYYFGTVEGGALPDVALVEGRAIDQVIELDATALGADGQPYRPITAPAPLPVNDDEDDWEWQPTPDWDRIDSALAAIPATDGDQEDTGGRNLWRNIGMALHHASGGSAEALVRWDDWSKGGEKYDPRVLRSQWKSFDRRNGGKRVRIGTLFDMAKRYGWAAKAPVASVADEIDQIGLGGAMAAPGTATELRFLTPDDCASTPSGGYVIKGLIKPRQVGCIFGAPGAGKSLISPHLGYAVARGQAAFGMRTKPGRVLYVAPEDTHGMMGRVTALKMRHGDAPDFIVVDGVSNLLVQGSPDLVALRAAVADQQPALIFLDTLAMSFPGLEENSAEGMGQVVAICRSLTKHGAAVILIHHDTKAAGATPRGHSLLNGALDMALQLFARDDAGVVRGKLTKNRNGPCDRDIAFRISTERLGDDEDGDPITAALVDELAPGAAPKQDKPTKAERAALKIFHDLSAGGTVTEDAWRAACVNSRAVCGSEDVRSRQTAVRRVVSGLAQRSLLILGDGLVRRPDSVGSAFDEND